MQEAVEYRMGVAADMASDGWVHAASILVASWLLARSSHIYC
jgi:hypothetical protein